MDRLHARNRDVGEVHADHLGARVAHELRGRVAHAARRADHEHALAVVTERIEQRHSVSPQLGLVGGPAGVIGGRSAVERMPGAAAHTYGTALTGRLAVYAGVNEPRSVSGTGNSSPTSKGASPRTAYAPPGGPQVPRRFDLGGAVPGGREPHDVVTATLADDRRPLGRDRARRQLARRELRRAARGGDRARARPGFDRTARRGRENTERTAEGTEQILRPLRVVRLDRPAEAHQFEDHVRRVALRHVGELVDLDAVDPALHR